jgi:hypothetical protein
MTKRTLIDYFEIGSSFRYQRANKSFIQHCCRKGLSPFLETRIGLISPNDIQGIWQRRHIAKL